MNKPIEFNGPLFIIGLSRSGTKLLRDILNNHPKISIPARETHFFPNFLEKFGISNINRESELFDILQYLRRTIFFSSMLEAEEFQGKDLDLDYFTKNCLGKSKTEFLRVVLQYFAEKTFEHTEIIWGDKTPNYLMYTGKLKETFRHAKFLHIIRDPRERSLSLRKAWHANIFKGAARWVDALNKYYQDRESFQQDCLDVHYEDLVKAPEMCITAVCHFLGIPFEKNVLTLRRSVEVYGDNKANTQSTRKIVVNINKYLKEFSENEVRRIEEITLPYLRRYNYPVHYAKYFRKLSKKEKLLYSLSDNFYGVVYHCRKWGLTKGLYFSYLRFRFNTMKSDCWY